jgi:hypothetical protein
MVLGNTRILFKACQKCGGDMYHNEDRYGAYYQCIQCARIVELNADSRTPGEELVRVA